MLITIENVRKMDTIVPNGLDKVEEVAKNILKNWKTTTVSDLKKLNRLEYYMTLAYVEQRYFELKDNGEECAAFEKFWMTVVTRGPSF